LVVDCKLTEESKIIKVVFDGECPFCRNFVHLQSIRSRGYTVNLIDARTAPDEVERLSRLGMNINDGMALWVDDTVYFGHAAVNKIAVLAEGETLVTRAMNFLLRVPAFSYTIYPLLKFGRSITLKVLGVRKI
jgi:predicted DCC family thiol-disulfide oxidoreductase YuxK